MGLTDRTERGSGYGRLYGPGVERSGVVAGERKVSRHEYTTFRAAPGGEPAAIVTMVFKHASSERNPNEKGPTRLKRRQFAGSGARADQYANTGEVCAAVRN